MDEMNYIEALDFLVRESKWKRAEVVADGTSAAWFVAARKPSIAEEAQRAGVVVAQGRPE